MIAAAQQGRQCQHADGDHSRTDDPGGGAHQHADQNDRDAHAAVHATHGATDGLEHVLGDPRFLEHDPHEHEQRYRQQRVIGDHTIETCRHQAEQQRAEACQTRQETGRRQ